MLDAIQRFLGVSGLSDAATLLGLPPDAYEPLKIESALRDRLEMVYQHPDGRSAEAEEVRQALRAAAEQLRQTMRRAAASGQTPRRRTASAPVFKLTHFDRLVLGVLIGSGGWNHRSRARLVALASTYGISVQGLLRILRGLADYARSGGPPLGLREVSPGAALTPYPPLSALTPPPVPPLMDRLAADLAAELRRDDPWPTIKLSAFFALVTLLAGIIAVRLVLSSEAPPAGVKTSEPAAEARPAGVASATQPRAASTAAGTRLARFSKPPTFLGDGLPVE